MTLFSGGRVEICGPAKFTLLLSGKAVTLALSFGRVRAELPATTALRIFTPTIVGTPIDISGRPRDVTVGLGLDDSLCVLATGGAIRLEQQFTGENIIVPEAGDFLLTPGQLTLTAETPGKCQCLAEEPDSNPSPVPEYATAPPAALPGVSRGLLEHANQGHPLLASDRIETPIVPPSSATTDTVAVPALVFTAGSPLPPPGPSEETLRLVHEAYLQSDWEFRGRVEPPEFATAVAHALGQQPPPPARQEKKKKDGFWAALKHVFTGGD